MPAIVLIRGGGDLASGVALRLRRAGLMVAITELPQPLVVRRLVSFAEAVYQGQAIVEGVTAQLVATPQAALRVMVQGDVAVLVDPAAEARHILHPLILIDGRMTKNPPDLGRTVAELVIGLGPGFIAGENCHAVVETQRGHKLGRVIWDGAAQPDSGIPDQIADRSTERILRAPADGVIQALAEIGDHLESGQIVATVAGQPVLAPFRGVLRGLVYTGLVVQRGLKIGDIDPRDDPSYCRLVSDKSLAIAGGVFEAILSRPPVRERLWDAP
jgi:xanthine dehydrogenase accessory factor